MRKIYSVIKSSGSYIPEKVVENQKFLQNEFLDKEGNLIKSDNESIIQKFVEITDIHERRHIENDYKTSDLAYLAAKKCLDRSDIDPESLDYIIVAHNFGDIHSQTSQTDIMPSLASRVKEKLGIENPGTIAYDTIFGCPGWVQAMIQADYYIRSGDAKRALVIGADVLSKLSDPHDRDSMIYADGAGAVVLEGVESETPIGILAHTTRTDSNGQTYNLYMGSSYNTNSEDKNVYIKMLGHKIYNYALTTVPASIKEGIDKAGLHLDDISKILIHQANAKMDEAILKRLFRLYNKKEVNPDIMPMTISKLGNSSVATIPTMLDLILSGELENHQLNPGNVAVFTSVGAGMNINAVIYKFPE
jgi:3-oxoacyl-[acyl-carrier-protein] synthase III